MSPFEEVSYISSSEQKSNGDELYSYSSVQKSTVILTQSHLYRFDFYFDRIRLTKFHPVLIYRRIYLKGSVYPICYNKFQFRLSLT